MPGLTTARHRPRTQVGSRPPLPRRGSRPRDQREPIRHWAGAQPERRQKSVALRTGKVLKAIEQRRAQLMKRRERELHLRLNPDRTQNSQIRRRGDRVVEKRGFPDPGLAFQHQRPASSSPRPIEQPIEHHALVSPTAQHHHPGAESPPAMGRAILEPNSPRGNLTGLLAHGTPRKQHIRSTIAFALAGGARSHLRPSTSPRPRRCWPLTSWRAPETCAFPSERAPTRAPVALPESMNLSSADRRRCPTCT